MLSLKLIILCEFLPAVWLKIVFYILVIAKLLRMRAFVSLNVMLLQGLVIYMLRVVAANIQLGFACSTVKAIGICTLNGFNISSYPVKLGTIYLNTNESLKPLITFHGIEPIIEYLKSYSIISFLQKNQETQSYIIYALLFGATVKTLNHIFSFMGISSKIIKFMLIFFEYVCGVILGFPNYISFRILRTLIPKSIVLLFGVGLVQKPHTSYYLMITCLPFLLSDVMKLSSVATLINRIIIIQWLFSSSSFAFILLRPIISFVLGWCGVAMFFPPFTPKICNLLSNMVPVLNHSHCLMIGSFSAWTCLFLLQLRNIRMKIICFFIVMVWITYPPFFSVHYINVGQGDATLIVYPYGVYQILIDTGPQRSWSTLRKYLLSHGVRKLDELIITHQDMDHCANKMKIIDTFKPIKIFESKGIDSLFLEELNVNHAAKSKNAMSIITKLDYKGIGFLFMGDAGAEEERLILRQMSKKDIHVLKLGHHGSKTSSSDLFIRALRPQFGIVSSDPKRYGHPHDEVIRRLHRYEISILQTSIHGNIKFVSMLNRWYIN